MPHSHPQHKDLHQPGITSTTQKTNDKQARGVINADVSTNGAGIAKHAKHYQTPLEAGGAWAKVVANLQPSGPPSKVPIPRRKPARP